MEGTSAAAALAIAGGSSLVPGFGWVIGGWQWIGGYNDSHNFMFNIGQV